MAKALETLLGIERRYVKAELTALREKYPKLDLFTPRAKAVAIFNYLVPRAARTVPNLFGAIAGLPDFASEVSVKEGWILPKHAKGHIPIELEDIKKSTKTLMAFGWGTCFSRACEYRILARHVGLKCRVVASNTVFNFFNHVYLNPKSSKKTIVDSRTRVFDKRPRCNYNENKRDYENCVELSDSAVSFLASAMKAESDAKKLRFLNLLIEKCPTYTFALQQRAELLFKRKKYEPAIRDLKNAIRAYPLYAEAYFPLKKIYTQQNKLEEFVEYLKKLLKKNPSNYRAHSALGEVYKSLGETAKAEELENNHVKIMRKGGASKKEIQAYKAIIYALRSLKN